MDLTHQQNLESPEDHIEKLRYLRMKKHQGSEFGQVLRISSKDVESRSSEEEFYLRMFLKCEVPFFYDYDRHTMNSIARVMHRVEFARRETIYTPG